MPAAAAVPADWLSRFPALDGLERAARDTLIAHAVPGRMVAGERAYLEGALARGYVLRLEGTTRVQKTSASGREVVLYRVGPGETCVLTTSCLLGRRQFPAEGVAESDVLEMVVPPTVFDALMLESEAFRRFVIANYGDLIGDLIMLLDDVMFRRLDIRLAERLTQSADQSQTVDLTHQQLALELGSAREAVSRLLKEFERKHWVVLGRHRIELVDIGALRGLAGQG